jgi:putative ABC transport system permease protein
MLADLRHALRQLAKAPGFTATVVIVLALGIGATTAIFSVINAVLLHPFPYQDGNRILFVGSSRLDHPNSQMPVAYLDYLEWRRDARSVEHLAFATGTSATLTGIPEPAVIRQGAVSAPVWPLLGMQPVLGRVFTDAEDAPAAPPVCVLSHATWQKRFSGDRNILNHPITLDGKSYTVIGVMPPAFKFWAADVWTPVGLQAGSDLMQSRIMRNDSWVVTRAAPGRTIEDVRAELSVIARQIAQQHPDSNRDVGVAMHYLGESVSGPFRNPLLLMLGAVVAVLLISCANVANLLLARTIARRREFAVRAALGASRGQLIRQTLVECVPLAVLGGIAALGLAVWGLDGLLAILPQDAVPAEAVIRVNPPVMFFTAAVTFGTMLLFALFPALEGSSAAAGNGLNEGSRGTASVRTGRIRAGLIVAEVSLSLMLLIGAGLLLRYGTSEQATRFFEDAVARLQSLPAVASVAASTNAPFLNGSSMPLVVEGRSYTELRQLRDVQFSLVTGDYFRAQGLRLVRGRVFNDTDRAGSQPVIVLNEAAVKKFLPEGDPLGKQVMLGAPDNLIKPGMLPAGFDKFQWATVVGVVQSARHFGLDSEAPAASYIPVRQAWNYPQMRRFMILLVRTHGRPLDAVPALRGLLKSLDQDLPVERISTMNTVIGDSLQSTRFNTVLLGLFAAIALALAAVGIYGVVAWNVTKRTREIGIRSALGATRRDVLRLVVGQGMKVVLLGVALGLAGSFAATRAMQGLLFETSTFDGWTFAVVSLLLASVALLACWFPARRATRVDPMVALRAD